MVVLYVGKMCRHAHFVDACALFRDKSTTVGHFSYYCVLQNVHVDVLSKYDINTFLYGENFVN